MATSEAYRAQVALLLRTLPFVLLAARSRVLEP
jgi:hypothetical protein